LSLVHVAQPFGQSIQDYKILFEVALVKFEAVEFEAVEFEAVEFDAVEFEVVEDPDDAAAAADKYFPSPQFPTHFPVEAFKLKRLLVQEVQVSVDEQDAQLAGHGPH